MAERPNKQGLLRGQLGRDGLRDVKAMHEQRSVAVGPCRQSSGQQAGEGAKRAACVTGRQTHRKGHEARLQLKTRMERATGDIESRHDGLAEKVQRKGRKRLHAKARSLRRQEGETGPGSDADRCEPHRKIFCSPSGDHEPETKEKRTPRRRDPCETRRVVNLGVTQG